MKSFSWMLAGLALVAVGCGRQSGAGGRDSVPAGGSDTIATAPVDTMPVDTTAVASSDSMKTPPLPPPRRPDSTPIPGTPDTPQIPTATVAEILGSSALVGKTVQVTGTCLGYRVPPVAVGNPPRTRSDWQLESGGVAVYVTGPMPAGCSATAGSTTTGTLIAKVLEDSMPALGTNPKRARRYLEVMSADRMPVRQ